jgi:hypothetical protein
MGFRREQPTGQSLHGTGLAVAVLKLVDKMKLFVKFDV